jgi:hypothetical protein
MLLRFFLCRDWRRDNGVATGCGVRRKRHGYIRELLFDAVCVGQSRVVSRNYQALWTELYEQGTSAMVSDSRELP